MSEGQLKVFGGLVGSLRREAKVCSGGPGWGAGWIRKCSRLLYNVGSLFEVYHREFKVKSVCIVNMIFL